MNLMIVPGMFVCSSFVISVCMFISQLSQCVDLFDLTGIILSIGTICQLSNMID